MTFLEPNTCSSLFSICSRDMCREARRVAEDKHCFNILKSACLLEQSTDFHLLVFIEDVSRDRYAKLKGQQAVFSILRPFILSTDQQKTYGLVLNTGIALKQLGLQISTHRGALT